MRVWANPRQRALDTAIAEITKKTDISIQMEYRVAGAIKTSAGNIGDVCHQGATGAGRSLNM